MKQVRVSTQNRNSAIEQTVYSKDGACFRIQTVWRLAIFLVDAQEVEKIKSLSLSDKGVVLTDFEFELDEAFDISSTEVELVEWNFPNTEFDRDEVISAFYDDKLETLGWEEVSSDWILLGELEFS